MEIKIVYEDEHVLVLNKPSGLLMHPSASSKEPTLSDWIEKKYPKITGVGEPMRINFKGEEKKIERPGIVHRLDRDTSGVVIVAKDQETFSFLKNQFHGRSVEKIYKAIVLGEVKEKRGKINRPIGRSPSDFRKWSATRGARGELREAITEYEVENVFSHKGEKFSLLNVMPKTGRTHQIRVHMKAVNHPIVGDKLYGGSSKENLGFDRPALHAMSISFSLPSGKKIKAEAPLPDDFKRALALAR